MLLHFLSHERQRIRKSGQGLAVTGILPDRDLTFLGVGVRQRKVTNKNRPNKAGIVRAMAQSDHWRWVSTPRWSLTS
jgi:hypothetical protein